jgi:hypothetical protein
MTAALHATMPGQIWCLAVGDPAGPLVRDRLRLGSPANHAERRRPARADTVAAELPRHRPPLVPRQRTRHRVDRPPRSNLARPGGDQHRRPHPEHSRPALPIRRGHRHLRPASRRLLHHLDRLPAHAPRRSTPARTPRRPLHTRRSPPVVHPRAARRPVPPRGGRAERGRRLAPAGQAPLDTTRDPQRLPPSKTPAAWPAPSCSTWQPGTPSRSPHRPPAGTRPSPTTAPS